MLDRLLQRIEEHLPNIHWWIPDFPIILHGGEPLLWGVENFHRFAEGCEAISSRTGCEIPIAVTTNGVLIDDEWLNCFEAATFQLRSVSMGRHISTTSPPNVSGHRHPRCGGTCRPHAGIPRHWRKRFGGLHPAYKPEAVCRIFRRCGIANYDIMIPDATVDEKPPSIASFYNGLFDLWLEANRGNRPSTFVSFPT